MGIEPTTFWFVVQYPKQLTTAYPSVHCKWVLWWRIQVCQDVTLCHWTSVSLCFEHSAFIFNGRGSTRFWPLCPWKFESSRALQCKIKSGLLFQSSSVQAPSTLDFTSLDGRNRTKGSTLCNWDQLSMCLLCCIAIWHSKHIDSQSQLHSIRLTHNTQHAATAPN